MDTNFIHEPVGSREVARIILQFLNRVIRINPCNK